MIEMALCKCGCGKEVKPGRLFILGHNNRKPKPEPILCECGCGEYAKPGNRFIRGHNVRMLEVRKKIQNTLIEYYKNNPEVRKKKSDSMRQYIFDHPELVNKMCGGLTSFGIT
jgi:hypothetical protein